MSTLVCWNCGASLEDIPRPISRHANCPKCFNELHCCRLCRHFDRNKNMACFEDRADPPLNKENANFCDFFSPAVAAFEQKTAIRSTAARSHLDALFGQADNAQDADVTQAPQDPAAIEERQSLSKEDQTKKKLDDLFR